MENLFNQLCIKYPDFSNSLDLFPEKVKHTILEKLKKEKDETKFTSTLAEIDFGLMFIKLGFRLEYDKLYNKQTPDWTISIGESKAICEVYRLGRSVNDQIISDSQSKHKYLSCYHPINYKPEKIIQFDYLEKDNNITCKLSKYNDVIAKTNYPYFIAIALDFASGFEFDHFIEYFLGKRDGFDCEEDSEYETLIEDTEYGTEWTELGIFYKNLQLSGLIILDKNKFHLLLNPLKKQIIYKDANKKILKNLLTLTIK